MTPELNKEIERLKEAFGFKAFGEMLESFARILQLIVRLPFPVPGTFEATTGASEGGIEL